MNRNQPEFQLHCLVADMLRLLAYPEIFWTHPPNGEHRSPRTGARLKRMGVKRGVADFLLLVRGKAIAIELKPEKGYQSKEQKEFQKEWELAGGEYHLTKGYQETVELLEYLRIIKPVRGHERFEPRNAAA